MEGAQFRKLLLRELGIDESKELMNISKYVRANSSMDKEDKKACGVCDVKNSLYYGKGGGREPIYNHHVMKVEYLAMLADKFDIVQRKKNKRDVPATKLSPGDYEYISGFEPYCPRVAVCDEHHTMFHELCGDNDLNKTYNVKLADARSILEIFTDINDDVITYCNEESKSLDISNYKLLYNKIWDEVVIKSLVRLDYVLRIRDLKMNNELNEVLYTDEQREYMSDLLVDLEDTIDVMLEYDKTLGVTIPERPIFSEKELKEINELIDLYENKDEEEIEKVDETFEIHEDICPISLAFSDDQDDDFDAELGM